MTYPYGGSVIPQLTVKKERWVSGCKATATPFVQPGQEVVPDQLVLRSTHPDHEHIPAGLHGRVVGFTSRGGVVIESRAALIQGLVGVGPQVAGLLTLWDASNFRRFTPTIPPGAILVVPAPLPLSLLHQAVYSGVVGIVASSIELRDLEGFLRTDYLQLLSADANKQAAAQLPPLTLLFTEGIGTLSMPTATIDLIKRYQGSIGLLSGTTSMRHHLYPDLIISLPSTEIKDWRPRPPKHTLTLGSRVRICGGKRYGTIGQLDYFFLYDQPFPSGIRTRAARVLLDDGTHHVVPLTLLERIS